MLNPRSLVEYKIRNVAKRGNPVEVGLLSILISCGGYIERSGGSYPALKGFSSIHRELIVEECKNRLIEEGVIREEDNRLEINYYPTSDDDWNEVIDNIGSILFIEGSRIFREYLAKITSIPECMYALQELCKSGASKETINRISSVIGGTYWDEVRNALEGAGLFGIQLISGKQTYFLFKPLADCVLLKDSNLIRQLCWIYIAQNVHSPGNGMRESECKDHCQSYEVLWAVGYVEKWTWYKLDLVRTTNYGSEIAKTHIKKIIQERKNELESLIKRQPLIRFIWRETFTDQSVRPWFLEWLKIWSWYGGEPSCGKKGSHACLLRDQRIRNKRDEILKTLKDMGLAAKATDYATTRGGETRDIYYIIAPEAVEFINRYLGEDKRPLLPEDIEKKHILFHIFETHGRDETSYRRGLIRLVDLKWECETWGIELEYALKELDKFKGKTLRFDEAAAQYVILDRNEYLNEVRRSYFKPIVEYVLEHILGRWDSLD